MEVPPTIDNAAQTAIALCSHLPAGLRFLADAAENPRFSTGYSGLVPLLTEVTALGALWRAVEDVQGGHGGQDEEPSRLTKLLLRHMHQVRPGPRSKSTSYSVGLYSPLSHYASLPGPATTKNFALCRRHRAASSPAMPYSLRCIAASLYSTWIRLCVSVSIPHDQVLTLVVRRSPRNPTLTAPSRFKECEMPFGQNMEPFGTLD